MKKIMFDDKYGLTNAVLEGRKTMTRRVIKAPRTMEGKDVYGYSVVKYPRTGVPIEVMALDADGAQINNILPKYKVGEVVAVAQSYLSIHNEMMDNSFGEGYEDAIYDPFRWAIVYDKPGWSNKMFVSADLMPHQIRITDVRVERLQDISDDDCIREGLCWTQSGFYVKYEPDTHSRIWLRGMTHRSAFAELIDKVSGKGVWQNNPWVFVYEFQLVK